ncbi:Ubiquilin-1 [Thelohanellus kitauei]|uniref:Ubiquilin-1 n=1 Tax=Thelohanellus kitauei TaxID=669202 RepID=A0A0C2MVE4_THEKT|nr:Ubiquilin-1 [Thelohanellus kitauei]
MKQMLDMMKNPNALKDALRNQDHILSQLQNIPGAIDQYMTLMNDVNRVKESTLSRFGPPAAQPVVSGPTNTDSSTANVSGEAMPNPWGPSQPSAQKQSSRSQTTGDDVPLYRDLIRAVTLTTTPDDAGTLQMLDQMKEIIKALSPRAQYGLTQYIAGLQHLREESMDLVAMILNYQLSCIRSTRAFLEGAAGLPSDDGQIPLDTGNEASYQAQLEELNQMGFSNKAENIKALQHSYGDVSAAVEWLLNRRPGL